MTQEQSGLGEQALNKMAEVALASQLEQAESLKVQVKTDPGKLAQGQVEAIAIEGEGLVMPPDMGVAKLQLRINQVTVKPLSALFGKLELTKPTDGSARIVIRAENLDRAFNSESFQAQLRQKLETVEIQHIKSRLTAGKLEVSAQLALPEATQLVAFTAVPRIGTQGQGVVLQEVNQTQGAEISPETFSTLVEQISEVLSLQALELDGMSLQIQQLEVAEGELILQAAARIEQFPSS